MAQGISIALIREIGDGKLRDYSLPLPYDWQRARSLVCLIAHHKITALLTPLPDGRGVMLKVAITV
ncbi:hypothetical protein [Nostoc sp.]|uniref:hypothetical protein n=1 Tax=Nostoc sp. TaxID=1180 RepID=UPI002FF7A8B7